MLFLFFTVAERAVTLRDGPSEFTLYYVIGIVVPGL
jgi:hypothetical protein